MRTIPTPGTFPDGCRSGIAVGAGAVWVTHGCQGIYRIDPHTGRVTASLRVPDAGDAVAVADGLVWVTSYHGDLLRIQPRTGQITGRPIPVGSRGLGDGPGRGRAVGDQLRQRQLRRNRQPGRPGHPEPWNGSGTSTCKSRAARSLLWTPQVQRIDPATGRVTASIALPGASQVAFWDGSAWALTVQQSLTLVRIDPARRSGHRPPRAGRQALPAALARASDPAIAAGPTGLWIRGLYRNLLFHLAMRSSRP